ncbi:membrane dipeptidase [Cytophagales bacterium LB-30]|uniref:Membrane dipeptidase n=1 Tax=Shiella aurantiaca TaxID=3058365 RepID=A0ABT8F579_9BACT|nr:membrane dipeptidase [Shiella aurantiaca]MDN4165610.1 membrane dipeptidase [Shiella aurantiaca]
MIEKPVVDLHCDLLSFLNGVKNEPFATELIGCALPHLKQGNVQLQVMAIYSDYAKGSVARAAGQGQHFVTLIENYPEWVAPYNANRKSDTIQCLVAIENATGFAEEDDTLEVCFHQLDELEKIVSRILYVGITHHFENRFGGGNYAPSGLTREGELLLEYLDEKKIAVDFAHTSDQLAYDIINYREKKGLKIPVMASHSNFRAVCDHVRNLPDDIAQYIIQHKGLIGINFMRDYIHPSEPSMLLEHVAYGLALGAENTLAFGADFFYTLDMPDQSRVPFFMKEHENATKYPSVLKSLEQKGISDRQLNKIAHQNALAFINRI